MLCFFIQFRVLFISLDTSSLTQGFLGNMFFSFQVFGAFHVIFLLWIYSWFHCGQGIYPVWFQFFLICWIFYDPGYSLSWYFCGHLKIMYILLVVAERWLMVLHFITSLLIFCSVVLAIVERRVLKSPTIIMHLSITLLSSITLFSSIFCLMNFAALVWCTHI